LLFIISEQPVEKIDMFLVFAGILLRLSEVLPNGILTTVSVDIFPGAEIVHWLGIFLEVRIFGELWLGIFGETRAKVLEYDTLFLMPDMFVHLASGFDRRGIPNSFTPPRM
jgi:hypothetical protein